MSRPARSTLSSVAPPRATEALTVAVAGHPALLLEALAGMLSASGFTVTAACSGPAELIEQVGATPPEVVLMDASGETGEPLAVLAQLRLVAPAVRCVLLVPSLTPELLLGAARAEVDGVIEGSCSAAELAASIRQIATGHAVFPAGWLTLLRRARADSLVEHLSARQLQVLELLSRGLTNHEIASQLAISLNTVKFHVREIYGRVGVANRVQAARLLAQHGGPTAGAVDRVA